MSTDSQHSTMLLRSRVFAELHCLVVLMVMSGIFFNFFQCEVVGPSHKLLLTGEDVIFMWNTTDGNRILSATWGIRNGNIADPQFINVNALTGTVNLNTNMDPQYAGRVDFIGHLKQGHAWFVLRNLTINDTNEYIASISDDESRVLPYIVTLKVLKERVFTTEVLTSKLPVTITLTRPTKTNDYERLIYTKGINNRTKHIEFLVHPSPKISTDVFIGPIVGCVAFVMLVMIGLVLWFGFHKRNMKQAQARNQKKDSLLQDRNA